MKTVLYRIFYASFCIHHDLKTEDITMQNTIGSWKFSLFSLIIFALSLSSGVSEPGRWEQELSGDAWRLWLDRDADWQNDDLYLPPVDISVLPANPPTCGWDVLNKVGDKRVAVPGTVEEYFWSANGNPNGTAGDYRGVSWWTRTFLLDPSLRGKRITIFLQSVNLRGEVYVNRKLVGYDVIGNTPFEVDVSNAVTFDGANELAIRVTDPVGTFSWTDENLIPWGKNLVPSVHGFGGITGTVFLRATDSVHVDDIYVQNKPQPRNADVFVTIGNSSGKRIDGTVSLVIREWNNPANILWKKEVPASIPPGGGDLSFRVSARRAKLWDIGKPNLYESVVTFSGDDSRIVDSAVRRFGFRFFEIKDKNGDRRFYLNGRRVFILAVMTRGFWPKNGMFPTPDMARKDMEAAQYLGCNMMLYHRAIGQPLSMEIADEMGMLTYEEPGGYLCNDDPDETAQRWRREKLRRMIIRDRSMPSLVIVNMDDLSFVEPDEDDIRNIRMVHDLDPSRPVTFNCITKPTIPNDPDYPFKLHMLPYDDRLHYHGWTSPYHLIRDAGYLDEYYRNPRYYLRYVIDPIPTMGDSLHPMPRDEIIFFGEEGAFGTMVRLEKIKNELARTGADGWREGEHLDWYESYDRFLDESGMRPSYPTVDHLTTALGENLYYFHGRIIENVRISNKADAYVMNGWASASTHTDIVDTYRNFTADPSILKRYTQPLYLAVKLRNKVMPPGTVPVADIFLVNETNLRGKYTLDLTFEDPDGLLTDKKTYPVSILGGEEFGQLLIEDVTMPPVEKSGYYVLRAQLRKGRESAIASGYDDIFVADYRTGPGIRGSVAVIDTSGVINAFLEDARGESFVDFDPSSPSVLDFLVIGAHDYAEVRSRGKGTFRVFSSPDPIMERVANGMTLVILDQADRWGASLTNLNYMAAQYRGNEHLGQRGRLFVGRSAFFDGLPKDQAMNWEYQVFYRGDVWGLRLAPRGLETVVGLAAQNNGEILSALSCIPYGNGRIILTTLNILEELASPSPRSAVAKKLFLNILEHADGTDETH